LKALKKFTECHNVVKQYKLFRTLTFFHDIDDVVKSENKDHLLQNCQALGGFSLSSCGNTDL